MAPLVHLTPGMTTPVAGEVSESLSQISPSARRLKRMELAVAAVVLLQLELQKVTAEHPWVAADLMSVCSRLCVATDAMHEAAFQLLTLG
jgi:cell division protein ZapA (FtsZ GTPase activity inhibitor)